MYAGMLDYRPACSVYGAYWSDTICPQKGTRRGRKELTLYLNATHSFPMVKRARGASAPVAALLVRSISSSDFPMLTTTRRVVLSCFLDFSVWEEDFLGLSSTSISDTDDNAWLGCSVCRQSQK